MDKKAFYDGKVMDAYHFFGAHPEADGVYFRTYAPRAKGVTVMGEWNGFQEFPMQEENGDGIFVCRQEDALVGQMYKYVVYGADGSRVEHCDPYGFAMELRPGSCSIITDLNEYTFGDNEWMMTRTAGYDDPVNIYEVHAGSWKRHSDEEETGWLSYLELAEQLVPYVKEHGYTHVEFLPLSEHPCDASWGYQNTGFFAPTSRYGTPAELKEMIDRFHQNGIGVILDFVLVHFAMDAYGLHRYPGEPLYESRYREVAESEWGTYNFNFTRKEVCSFLQSCANYWLAEYHFDGLRMDAVSRLIYWQGEEVRGANPLALNFIRYMNENLKQLHPTCMLIAEDSTAFPGVTKPAWMGGLGFDYKWDLGWMHDTLSYMKTGPWLRGSEYHKLTFSMMYYYNERFLLPFSHDEVVHGKATILQKMYGDYAEKFPQARLLYLYMMLHPGKKLNYMGNEFGQLREWDEKREQDWLMLAYPKHAAFDRYMTDLNQLYLAEDAFHMDYRNENFRWEDCHQEQRCIYAIKRNGSKAGILGVLNFSGIEQGAYQIWLPAGQQAEIVLHTDELCYDGTTACATDTVLAKEQPEGVCLSITLPAFSGVVFRITEKPAAEKTRTRKKKTGGHSTVK